MPGAAQFKSCIRAKRHGYTNHCGVCILQGRGRAEAPSAPSLECLRTFNGASFSTPHADIIYAYVGATGAKNKHEDAKNG